MTDKNSFDILKVIAIDEKNTEVFKAKSTDENIGHIEERMTDENSLDTLRENGQTKTVWTYRR